MLQKHYRKVCCPEPEPNVPVCGDLSYDQCNDICYSAGNNLSYDPQSALRVNLCVNPCYASLDTMCNNPACRFCRNKIGIRDRDRNCRIQNRGCDLTSKICNNETRCKKPDCCILPAKYRFVLVDLISNRLNFARVQDPELVNPIGGIFIDGVIWAANNGTGSITTYDIIGNKLGITAVVTDAIGVKSSPTGLIENQTIGFTITNGTLTVPSFLLVATANGVISGFNTQLSSTRTFVVVDRSPTAASYRGLVIVNDLLYVTDFFNRTIDVFDQSFAKMTGYNFTDGDTRNPLPLTYGPFSIKDIGGMLYVTYALQSPTNRSTPQFGQGAGYINVFTYGGVFVRRFVTKGYLNIPWGMSAAPESSGFPLGTIFVGNNGDGIINIYDPSGIHLGKMTDLNGRIVQLSGLWELMIRDPRSFYFLSGPNSQTDGLIGILSNGLF